MHVILYILRKTAKKTQKIDLRSSHPSIFSTISVNSRNFSPQLYLNIHPASTHNFLSCILLFLVYDIFDVLSSHFIFMILLHWFYCTDIDFTTSRSFFKILFYVYWMINQWKIDCTYICYGFKRLKMVLSCEFFFFRNLVVVVFLYKKNQNNNKKQKRCQKIYILKMNKIL